MYWIDDRGELHEGDEATGRRYGYREATEDDLRAHNERLDTQAADTKGPLGLIGEGFERGLAHVQELSHQTGITPPMAGGDAFGMGGGPLPGFGQAPPEAPAPPSGAETFPEATSDEARLRAKAHPVYEGIGTGLAVAPISALAGAAGGALGGAGLAAAAGGIGAEAIVEAAAQEYDDAWLEQRPVELKNVAAYTAMFALGDVLLRGVAHGAGKLIDSLPTPARGSPLGPRNIVAEAQAKAEKAGSLRPAQSVGAASARDMNEPFDEALATMTDRDAMVLARDADDHFQLVGRDAADELTRIHRALTDQLGSQLKYQDFQIGADAWTNKILEHQGQWIEDVAGAGQEVINRIRGDALDYGNAGKAVAADIENYSDLLMNEADNARRNYLADQFKKKLDSRIMQIAGDYKGDTVARTELLKILEPFAGSATEKGMLREGLENPKYWGHNAELQKALNAPWHDLLKHWRKFQEKLYEASGETRFGEMGAGRNIQESTAERVLSVIQKDPRILHDLGQHVAGTFDGYQRLIEARQSHGIVKQEGLEGLNDSIRNLMEDWNLATTIGVAKNRAANAAKNPRNWHLKALDLAEKAPFGVGTAVGAARAAGRLAGDLHVQPGTPLADVWDRGLKRYATNPSLADSSINQSYSDWMQAALRQRGAPIPDRRTAWGGIKDAAAEHGGKVAGGIFGAGAEAALSQPQVDENGQPVAQASGGGALLGAALGGAFKSRALRRLAGHLSEWDIAKEVSDEERGHLFKLLKEAKVPKGKDPRSGITTYDASRVAITPEGKPIVFDDKGFAQSTGRHHYQAQIAEEPPKPKKSITEMLADGDRERAEAHRLLASVERAEGFGKRAHRGYDTIEVNEKALKALATKTGKDIKQLDPEEQVALLDYIEGGGAAAFRGLQRGEPLAGKERYAAALPAFESAIEQLQQEGLTEKIGPLWRGMTLSPEQATALVNSKFVETGALTSTSFSPFHASDKFADTPKARELGHVPVVLKFEKVDRAAPISAAGFSKQYGTGEREAILPKGGMFEVTGATRDINPSGGSIEVTLREVPRKVDGRVGFVLTGLLGLGAATAAGDASAAEPAPPPDVPEAPDLGQTAAPGTLYREALRSVAGGAPAIIQRNASAALRRKPPVGRDPLRTFIGRKDLDGAVDSAREAITALQGDPEALIDQLGGSTGELARTHPSLYYAITQKAAGIVAYLSAEVPQRTGKTLLDPEGMPPSRDRSVDFVYKAVGAAMPLQAMSDITRLDAPPEEVQSFQQNWPELWEPLRFEMLGQIQRRYEVGRPIDTERLRQLDGLLGMNGQLDPSASAEVAQQIISAASQAPAAPAGNSAPSQAPSPTGRASGMLQTRLAGMQMEATNG